MLRLGVPTHYQNSGSKNSPRTCYLLLALEVPPHPWIQLHSEQVVPQHSLLKKKIHFYCCKKSSSGPKQFQPVLSRLAVYYSTSLTCFQWRNRSSQVTPPYPGAAVRFSLLTFILRFLSSPFSKHIIWNKNYKSCEIVRDAN